MGARRNIFLVNSIISQFPIKWEIFLRIIFKRQSCNMHHKFPVEEGGDVYNLDNLKIMSPATHKKNT